MGDLLARLRGPESRTRSPSSHRPRRPRPWSAPSRGSNTHERDGYTVLHSGTTKRLSCMKQQTLDQMWCPARETLLAVGILCHPLFVRFTDALCRLSRSRVTTLHDLRQHRRAQRRPQCFQPVQPRIHPLGGGPREHGAGRGGRVACTAATRQHCRADRRIGSRQA